MIEIIKTLTPREAKHILNAYMYRGLNLTAREVREVLKIKNS